MELNQAITNTHPFTVENSSVITTLAELQNAIDNSNGTKESPTEINIDSAGITAVSYTHLILQNAIVHGNVTSNNQISIDRDTEVVGDLTARSIIIGGNLKGNVFAEESVLIQEQAVIKGDISTGLIDIRQGAQLSGKVETGVDVKNKKKAE